MLTNDGRLIETRDNRNGGPKLIQVKASAKPVKRAAVSGHYQTLASIVGLDSAATDEIRVLNALADAGFKTYNYDLVDGYLYRQAIK
jgi:hypothetical protein